MISPQTHPVFHSPLYFNGGKVDKGSNRKTPGTAGEGPRPPRRNEYPDQEEKKKEKSEKKEQKK